MNAQMSVREYVVVAAIKHAVDQNLMFSGELTSDTLLTDLGDSLDLVRFQVELEALMECRIADAEFRTCKTLGDLLKLLTKE